MTRCFPDIRFARVCAVLSALLLLGAPWGLAWLHVDNGIEQWVTDESRDGSLARFHKDFGGDDFTLLAYGGRDLFDETSLDIQLDVLAAMEAIPAVTRVDSLPRLFRDQFGAERPDELAGEVASSPFYDHLIVSEDRTMGAMIVRGSGGLSPRERHDYIDAIRKAAEPLRQAGWDVHLVGPGALNVALDLASERESRRLLPVSVALSGLLLMALLRCARKVLAVAAVATVSLLLTLGLMGWLGITMNMVTVAVPPVLWVLSLAYTVHLLRYYDSALREVPSPGDAMALAIRCSAKPSFLAALTTALGFLTQINASMKPVCELGLAAGLGIPVALAVTFGVGPMLFVALRIHETPLNKRPVEVAPGAPMHRVHHGRFAGPVLAGTVLATVLCALLATRVRTESNPLNFLPPDSEIVRDSSAVAEQGLGLYTLETVLDLPGNWLDASCWPAIEAQAAALEKQPGITRVVSPLDYLKKLNQWDAGGGENDFRLPASGEAASRLVDSLPDEDRGPLEALVSPDGRRVRLSALVTVMDGTALINIVRASDKALAGAPEGVSGEHTGVVLHLVQAQLALIESQLTSLGLAIPMIFGCVGVGLWSFRLLLLSLAPNILPVLALFGIMGATRIPLDPATAVVAAMALGIAVDDTMHLLVTWEERKRAGSGAPLQEALQINGLAMLTTAATACVGFLALGLSEFGPIRYYGLLSAAAMAIALAADFWLLPAQIAITERFKERRA